MNIAKKFAAAGLLAVSLMMTGCGQGQIGCVDVSKVMAEAPRVKTLMDEAEAKMKEAQQKYEQEVAAKPDMSQEEAAKLQGELQRKLIGINQATSTQIKSRLDVVVGEIAQAKNLDVVISNPADEKILFQGGVDVTDDVIKKMQ